ncbi:MAG: hypothetical protein HC878_20435 [Leptolyngbyaceae cyanobacterium SL_5_14]|nr:hypothetical protein [Leptolyngbyaceae cyanobacterium SL_5_14]
MTRCTTMEAIDPFTSVMLLSKGRIFGRLQTEGCLRGRVLSNGLINGGNGGAIAWMLPAIFGL